MTVDRVIGFSLVDDATPEIKRLAKETPGALDHAAVRAATLVQREAKINVKQKLNTTGQATGNLGRGITVVGRRGTGSAAVGPQAIYGAIHEFGGVIKPVRAKALAFTLPDGTFVMTGKVVIPARPYMEPAMETVQPQVPGIVREEIADLLS